MKLSVNDVDITIETSYEDDITPEEDTFEYPENVVQWINNQLAEGNMWAWCEVKITGRYKGLEVSSYLGGCSYKNEEDFISGGYYDDMVEEIRDELESQVNDIIKSQ